jgi:hypothetical protein
MTRDDDFEPKLGRIRSRGSWRGGKYLHRVLRALALAGVGCEAARYRGAARSTAASSDAAPASAGCCHRGIVMPPSAAAASSSNTAASSWQARG